jgi:hypothetical protein
MRKQTALRAVLLAAGMRRTWHRSKNDSTSIYVCDRIKSAPSGLSEMNGAPLPRAKSQPILRTAAPR